MIKLYNTLSKQIEEFKPLDKDVVRMYTCGPTVYNFAHIGNLRAFITADLLYRTLNFDGYNVDWVMNITDIDDKTIKGAIAEYGSDADANDLYRFTQKYLDAFIEDLKSVNVSVDGIRFIRVTDKMAEMQKFIVDLIDKGYAYKADDGSTYFSIEKYQADFGDYGDLVGQGFMEGKKVNARVANDEYEKDDLSDFALWKTHSADDAQIFWDHPILGKGRPGWHIECSVINYDAFEGKTTDIHTGGIDLMFPHHTNEIAQSQALLGKGNFVKHWFHSDHLLVDDKKMAKSQNNFYTLKDIERQVSDPIALRYLFLQSHYKSQQNFTHESLTGSESALHKLRTAYSSPEEERMPEGQERFKEALSNDLNTAQALAIAWEDKASLSKYDEVLGLQLDKSNAIEIPDEIKTLLDERQTARDNKDFTKSDELRDEIAKLGYEVLDTPDGQKVKRS
jgi:cysteinyl-tRNA synthetase